MSIPYFFEPSLPNQPGHFTLSPETSKHCVQVLRMKEGAMMVLTDGMGNCFDASIISANKVQAVVMLSDKKQIAPHHPISGIAISFVKNPSRMEWFLEKATEIGIGHFYPLIAERTEKQHFKAERWESIIVSAMLQSQQSWKPILHQPIHFDELIVKPFDGLKMIAHCEGTEKMALQNVPLNNNQLILIGPEGDFSTTEIEVASNQGFIPVSLGTNRLRTETAGLVAAVLLQHR
jgi:16S rRNA (uracil1498-N3)-methyltransferase